MLGLFSKYTIIAFKNYNPMRSIVPNSLTADPEKYMYYNTISRAEFSLKIKLF